MPRKAASSSDSSNVDTPVDTPATPPTETSADKPLDSKKGDPDFKVDQVDPSQRKDLPKDETPDDSWKYDGVQSDETDTFDRGRKLREEVNVNGSGHRSDSLADAVGNIAKGLGYSKGIDAHQDVIGRERVKGKVSDGNRAIDFNIQVDRQLDPVRLNPINWDKTQKHNRNQTVDRSSHSPR